VIPALHARRRFLHFGREEEERLASRFLREFVDVFFGLEHSFEAVLDAFFERDKSTYEGFYGYGVVGD
jgi:hypothetical protein